MTKAERNHLLKVEMAARAYMRVDRLTGDATQLKERLAARGALKRELEELANVRRDPNGDA